MSRPVYCKTCGTVVTDLDDPFYFSGASFVIPEYCEEHDVRTITKKAAKLQRKMKAVQEKLIDSHSVEERNALLPAEKKQNSVGLHCWDCDPKGWENKVYAPIGSGQKCFKCGKYMDPLDQPFYKNGIIKDPDAYEVLREFTSTDGHTLFGFAMAQEIVRLRNGFYELEEAGCFMEYNDPRKNRS